MEFSPFNYDLAASITHPYLSTLSNYFILSSELQEIKFHQQQPLVMHNHLLPIKDILEFASQPIYEPNYSYRNLLYIYPLAINLCGASSSRSMAGQALNNSVVGGGSSGTSGLINGVAGSVSSSSSLLNSSSARNIAIKVNFMKGKKINK